MSKPNSTRESNFNISDNKQLTGAILIGVGVLALLGVTGIFRFVGGIVGALIFGALAYYAYTQGERRGNTMWRLAAFPLAGLALTSILPGSLGGATFLASLGLAFALFWQYDKSRWWALIPAGTLASLAAVAFLEGVLGMSAGWLFLVGLAATFFALTRLQVEPQPWAIWPAGGLAAVSLMAFVDSGSWLLPLLLIAGGGWLLIRSGAVKNLGQKSETGDVSGPLMSERAVGAGVEPRGTASEAASDSASNQASSVADADPNVAGADVAQGDTQGDTRRDAGATDDRF